LFLEHKMAATLSKAFNKFCPCNGIKLNVQTWIEGKHYSSVILVFACSSLPLLFQLFTTAVSLQWGFEALRTARMNNEKHVMLFIDSMGLVHSALALIGLLWPDWRLQGWRRTAGSCATENWILVTIVTTTSLLKQDKLAFTVAH